MRLLFIRHGEPDYTTDTLTAKGIREASLLGDYLPKRYHIDQAYVSPLGRAQETCALGMKNIDLEPITMEWLEEFYPHLDLIRHPEVASAYNDTPVKPDGTLGHRIYWDMLPSYIVQHPELLDNQNWRNAEVCYPDFLARYDEVCERFDEILAANGYRRDGLFYKVEEENTKTLAFFCHLGVSSVLLSHLWNTSPFLIWHMACVLTTSITESVTEEREKGLATFRTLRLGSTAHLDLGSEPDAFIARFSETFSDPRRH